MLEEFFFLIERIPLSNNLFHNTQRADKLGTITLKRKRSCKPTSNGQAYLKWASHQLHIPHY